MLGPIEVSAAAGKPMYAVAPPTGQVYRGAHPRIQAFVYRDPSHGLTSRPATFYEDGKRVRKECRSPHAHDGLTAF